MHNHHQQNMHLDSKYSVTHPYGAPPLYPRANGPSQAQTPLTDQSRKIVDDVIADNISKNEVLKMVQMGINSKIPIKPVVNEGMLTSSDMALLNSDNRRAGTATPPI